MLNSSLKKEIKRSYDRYNSIGIENNNSFFLLNKDLYLKIILASEGKEILTKNDCQQILLILKDEKEYEREIETKMASLIFNNLEEGFLRYLNENYNKLITIKKEEGGGGGGEKEEERDQEKERESYFNEEEEEINKLKSNFDSFTKVIIR